MNPRTLLFMPGNNPGMLAGSPFLGADMVIFDLEDAVARTEKDAARNLVRHALQELQPRTVAIMVRINGLDTPYWEEDVTALVAGGADAVMLPKCEDAETVLRLVRALEQAEVRAGARTRADVVPIVETALGIERAFDVAAAHSRVAGMLLGAEDLTASTGARRTPAGEEIRYARGRLLNACKAANIPAIDTPYPFVNDLEGLKKDTAFAVALGFDAKAVISPQHVHLVSEAFMPSQASILWAERVREAAVRAEREGKGAVSLDGMMIDLPVIKQAERILFRAGL